MRRGGELGINIVHVIIPKSIGEINSQGVEKKKEKNENKIQRREFIASPLDQKMRRRRRRNLQSPSRREGFRNYRDNGKFFRVVNLDYDLMDFN